MASSARLVRPAGLAGRAGVALVAALLVVDLAALVHVLVHVQHHGQAPAIVPARAASNLPPEIAAAAAWAGSELSHGATLIADPTMRSALTARGFTHVRTPATLATAGPAQFDYTISTAQLRAAARPGTPAARALGSSLPIAVFGTGTDQVIVRQVSSLAPAVLAARHAADLRTRISGERQLLTNPAVRAGAAARAVLRGGELDLRAATVLSLMANSSHVDLISVNVDQPERRAGLPARSIDVRTDADAAVEAMLSNLPPSYRPTRDVQLPSGARRLVWPIDPVPPSE